MRDIFNKNFPLQMMLRVSFSTAIIMDMSVFLMKLIIWFMKLLPFNTSKIFFLIMRGLLVNGFDTKNVFGNESDSFSNTKSDDDGYETAISEIANEFFDADEGVYTDSDSDSFGYESAEEETLEDFHDPHQYSLKKRE